MLATAISLKTRLAIPMTRKSKSSFSTDAATKLSPPKTAGDNLSPKRSIRACADESSSRTDTESEEPEICDHLAAAKDAIYPVTAVCVLLLTFFAVCYSLYFTKAVMLPIVGAFLLNFLFSPIVLKLNRAGLPNVAGTLVVLGFAIGAILIALAFAYQPATTWLAEREQNFVIVKRKLNALKQPIKAIKDVSEQIDEISSSEAVESESSSSDEGGKDGEKLKAGEKPKAGDEQSQPTSENSPEAKSSTSQKPMPTNALQAAQKTYTSSESGLSHSDSTPGEKLGDVDGSVSGETGPVPDLDVEVSEPTAEVVPVEVQQPSISNRIFSTTGDVIAKISLMLVLLFYLLSAGDRGLEKLVRLMPTFQGKKRVVELTRAIEKSVSDYLLTTTLINFGLGVVIGTGMWLIGMPNPILWGAMAMLLNFFPFIGAIFGAAIVFLAAVVSFDSLAYAGWAPLIYLSANLIEANFITPILLGRSVSLHPVWLMIFFVIVAWGWGLGGAIVAVPVLAVIKITCDHVEPLMPIGEFLGR